MKYRNYKKELDFSYTLGFFPTIELLSSKPEIVEKVLFSYKAIDSEGFGKIQSLCRKHNILLEKDDKTVDILSNKDNTFVIGIFKKFDTKIIQNQNHIVLYNPSDIGNLGMIIRSALGFNIFNIAIIRPAVDIFNPKVVRATMGAFFKINFEYFNSIDEYLSKFKNTFYFFDIKGERLLSETTYESPFSLIFGNEGAGLPDEVLTKGNVLRIDQSDKIDSLNLANSVSIASFWAMVKK